MYTQTAQRTIRELHELKNWQIC